MKDLVKHTKGEWTVQRTSNKDGDFQARILCESSIQKSHESNYKNPQIFIIVGEPSKRNGAANIHHEANAKLIAAAPLMLKEHMMDLIHLETWKSQLIEAGLRGSILYQEYLDMIKSKEQVIKKAKELE